MENSNDVVPTILTSLGDTRKKVTSSLSLSLEDHVTSDSFDHQTDGLDFLEVKNSLMLSYLIDLTQLTRLRSKISKGNKQNENELKSCLGRLQEMRVALDKMRPMEKKMRYSLDKLLAVSASSSTFAISSAVTNSSVSNVESSSVTPSPDTFDQPATSVDPLSFRPNLESMEEKDNDSSASDDVGSKSEYSDNEDSLIDSDNSDADESDDDELQAAKTAFKLGRRKGSRRNNSDDDDSDNDNNTSGVYKAPRMVAVPFAEKEKDAAKEQRLLQKQRNRMRKSELLSTLKANYGDAPEEDDIRGGATLGKQRDAAKRLAERDSERTKYEEDAFIRMTTSREEKKMRNRIMRDEISNMNSIADLSNLTAGVSTAFGDKPKRRSNGGRESSAPTSRDVNGKRRRNFAADEFKESGNKSNRRQSGGKNSFQKALYGTAGSSSKKKKSKK